MPAKTVPELIAHAGKNPGKLTVGYGSSSSRIAGEMLRTMGGIDIRPVPYKSNPQAITPDLRSLSGLRTSQSNPTTVPGFCKSARRRFW